MRGPDADALLAFVVVVFGGGALIQLAHHFLGLSMVEGTTAFEALPILATAIAGRFLLAGDRSRDD